MTNILFRYHSTNHLKLSGYYIFTESL